MTDRDRQRRRAELKRRKKRRQKTITAAAVILLAFIVFIVAAAGIRLLKGGREQPDTLSGEAAGEINQEPAEPDEEPLQEEIRQEDGSEDPKDSQAEQEEETPAQPELLTFSETDLRAGDLILVNRTNAYDFEANAADLDLTNIREGQSFYYQVGNTSMAVAGRILGPLDQLVAACNQAVGTELTGIESAHRSLEYQQRVWDEMEELYGREYCETYVATPGYSEHHTGLAVDMGIFYPGGEEGSFSESQNAVWMNDNACHYGFIRRYAAEKADITGYSNESWHFRYVGIPHAVYMTQNDLCLEEYIEKLMTETGPGAPLVFEADGTSYEVYYTDQLTIEKPEGDYTVSGSNTGGLIVTVR